MRTGITTLTLDMGKVPKWLFEKMVRLARSINEILIDEYGQDEYLRRISNPLFFQSFINTLAFDWNSSGSTTVLTAVLKESLNKQNLGVYVAGGKGRTSRKVPDEIEKSNLSTTKIKKLKYASKIAGKVDSNLVQDNYVLYHHSFFFNEKGKYAIVQQGMNTELGMARRYHWLSEEIDNYIIEPHKAICCDSKNITLNLTSKKSDDVRKISLDLIRDNPMNLRKYFLKKGQKSLNEYFGKKIKILNLPRDNEIDWKKLEKIYNIQPRSYEELVALKGVGAKTLRALALISQLIYGVEIDWKDPVKFSYAHGGKDGVPYPVNKKRYNETIEIIENAVKQAKLRDKDKLKTLKRVKDLYKF